MSKHTAPSNHPTTNKTKQVQQVHREYKERGKLTVCLVSPPRAHACPTSLPNQT